MAKKNKIINSLSEEEREALALCGIVQDDQLARISPQALLRDMQTANALLPDSLESLPEFSRLEAICQQAAGTVKLPAGEAAPQWQGKMHSPLPQKPFSHEEEPENLRFSPATGRMLVEHEARKATMLDEERRKADPRDFAHSIRCAHPFAIYLNAWVTWCLAIVVGLLLLGVVGILIGIEYTGPAIPLVAVLIFVVLSYAILLKSATCSTCRISIFSFRRYPKHRKAHHFPLLGHVLPTALSVMFCFRFRCPSCGTPQKLFGKHRRRHKH